MKQQLALDDISLDGALTSCRQPPRASILSKLARLRLSNLPILADTKIMDAGEHYVTVLGVTDLLTVKACIEVAARSTA